MNIKDIIELHRTAGGEFFGDLSQMESAGFGVLQNVFEDSDHAYFVQSQEFSDGMEYTVFMFSKINHTICRPGGHWISHKTALSALNVAEGLAELVDPSWQIPII